MKKSISAEFQFYRNYPLSLFSEFCSHFSSYLSYYFSGPNQKDIEVAASRTLKLYGFKG